MRIPSRFRRKRSESETSNAGQRTWAAWSASSCGFRLMAVLAPDDRLAAPLTNAHQLRAFGGPITERRADVPDKLQASCRQEFIRRQPPQIHPPGLKLLRETDLSRRTNVAELEASWSAPWKHVWSPPSGTDTSIHPETES